jgi:hypothetical protein
MFAPSLPAIDTVPFIFDRSASVAQCRRQGTRRDQRAGRGKSEYNNRQPNASRSPFVDDQEKHRICTNKFIELANQLKDKETQPPLISGAMMTACAVYATYVAAGNKGVLEPSGVDKVVALYRRTLEHHQKTKKDQLHRDKADKA